METNFTSLAYKEAQGISKCFEAYSEYAAGEEIMEVGFNPNSGYTYIALEFCAITICSMMGGDVEYLVTDFETGEEFFFNEYDEALDHLDMLPA